MVWVSDSSFIALKASPNFGWIIPTCLSRATMRKNKVLITRKTTSLHSVILSHPPEKKTDMLEDTIPICDNLSLFYSIMYFLRVIITKPFNLFACYCDRDILMIKYHNVIQDVFMNTCMH